MTGEVSRDMKRTSLTAVRILGICEKINEELQQKQKLYVLVQLMDFILFGAEITENELDFLETVSIAFNIPDQEFQNIRSFILNSVNEIPEKSRVMIIDAITESEYDGSETFVQGKSQETVFFFFILKAQIHYILKYSGNEDLFLNGQNIFPGQTYTFDHGSTIRGSGY